MLHIESIITKAFGLGYLENFLLYSNGQAVVIIFLITYSAPMAEESIQSRLSAFSVDPGEVYRIPCFHVGSSPVSVSSYPTHCYVGKEEPRIK